MRLRQVGAKRFALKEACQPIWRNTLDGILRHSSRNGSKSRCSRKFEMPESYSYNYLFAGSIRLSRPFQPLTQTNYFEYLPTQNPHIVRQQFDGNGWRSGFSHV